jgi:hypothetical protein
MTDELRYPIGPEPPLPGNARAERAANIAIIESLPDRVRDAVRSLTDGQLDVPYRAGGWTVRQVVHHLADSHLNGYMRVKLALTEEAPTIKPYDEAAWARLVDSRLPIAASVAILEGVHARWTALYRGLDDLAFARTFQHPERGESISIERHLHIYAWHSRHHVAHITALRQREGW